jgi:hypothetical protein
MDPAIAQVRLDPPRDQCRRVSAAGESVGLESGEKVCVELNDKRTGRRSVEWRGFRMTERGRYRRREVVGHQNLPDGA